jgi:hypothetical protein
LFNAGREHWKRLGLRWKITVFTNVMTAYWIIFTCVFRNIMNSMEQSPWEENSHSASQEIPCFYGTHDNGPYPETDASYPYLPTAFHKAPI